MEPVQSQLSFMDETNKGLSAPAGASGGVPGSGGSRGNAAAPLLELKGNTVDNSAEEGPEKWDRESVEHVLVSCTCRSRFCPDCSTRQGIALRIRVKAAMAHWEAVQMWTLTIDPKLFTGGKREVGEQAFRYVRDKKCISEWVKSLHRDGYLISNEYFCVVEWQKNGMPHWHILLHTKRIPHEHASQKWNLQRPRTPEQIAERKRNTGRELFGHIFFTSQNGHKSVEHAVNYSTKYVIKYPENGFPDWVLDFEGRIDRYSASQKFFTRNQSRQCTEPDVLKQHFQQEENQQTCEPGCDCPDCRGDDYGERQRKNRRTIRERIARCASKCSVLLKRRRWDSEGNELKPDYSYAFSLDLAYYEAALELEHYDSRNETVLTAAEYHEFRERAGISDDTKQYQKFDPSLLWRNDGAHYGGKNYEYIIS